MATILFFFDALIIEIKPHPTDKTITPTDDIIDDWLIPLNLSLYIASIVPVIIAGITPPKMATSISIK